MVDQLRAQSDAASALARLYDLDLAEDPGDIDLYLALAARTGAEIWTLDRRLAAAAGESAFL